MNIVCGFLDHLLHYFAELKHLNAFHRILYHACSDKILSTVTYSHVHAYTVYNNQWYYHTELDSAWQFSYRTDVHVMLQRTR